MRRVYYDSDDCVCKSYEEKLIMRFTFDDREEIVADEVSGDVWCDKWNPIAWASIRVSELVSFN